MSDTLRVGSMGDSPQQEVLFDEPVEEEVVNDVPDEDEELWLGGPTFAQIDEWRKQYDGQDIYVTSVTPEKHYVWRTISRPEYRTIVKDLEMRVAANNLTQAEATMDNEEAIARICILYPLFSGSDLGGVASLISQEVLEASGFQALEVRQL